MSLCFAPVFLAGYVFTLFPNHAHVTTVNAPTLELQTCETGLGLHVKGATSGIFGAGLQYGLTKIWGDWRMTVQPRAGLSITDSSIYELPQQKQFEIGLQLLAGYREWRVGVEWWHLSNAGMQQPNIGLDMLVVHVGRVFEWD